MGDTAGRFITCVGTFVFAFAFGTAFAFVLRLLAGDIVPSVYSTYSKHQFKKSVPNNEYDTGLA